MVSRASATGLALRRAIDLNRLRKTVAAYKRRRSPAEATGSSTATGGIRPRSLGYCDRLGRRTDAQRVDVLRYGFTVEDEGEDFSAAALGRGSSAGSSAASPTRSWRLVRRSPSAIG
jgi:hypothetical protein